MEIRYYLLSCSERISSEDVSQIINGVKRSAIINHLQLSWSFFWIKTFLWEKEETTDDKIQFSEGGNFSKLVGSFWKVVGIFTLSREISRIRKFHNGNLV